MFGTKYTCLNAEVSEALIFSWYFNLDLHIFFMHYIKITVYLTEIFIKFAHKHLTTFLNQQNCRNVSHIGTFAFLSIHRLPCLSNKTKSSCLFTLHLSTYCIL